MDDSSCHEVLFTAGSAGCAPAAARCVLWFRVARAAVRGFLHDDGPGVAAEVAYRFFLALTPFFIFLASLSGFIAAAVDVPDAAERLTALVSSALPPSVWRLL